MVIAEKSVSIIKRRPQNQAWRLSAAPEISIFSILMLGILIFSEFMLGIFMFSEFLGCLWSARARMGTGMGFPVPPTQEPCPRLYILHSNGNYFHSRGICRAGSFKDRGVKATLSPNL